MDDYYVEYDEDSAAYCVFNAVGIAVASFAGEDEAMGYAAERNLPGFRYTN